MNAVAAPPGPPDRELQLELTRLVDRFTLCTVIETLGVVCELRACFLHESDGTAPRMRKVSLALIELSTGAFAL